MLRLFTCIWVTDELKERITKIQKDLMKLPMKAKFVEPENLHITVVFLGDFSEDKMGMLKKTLDDSVKNMKKFHVKLDGLKIIPHENFIRVIGINVKDDENNISKLIKAVGESIHGKYYESAKLTLCRVNKVFDKKSLKEFIEKNINVQLGTLEVNSVSLVESKLTKKGPIYKTVHRSVLS